VEKSAQQPSAELALLQDENYARLKNRLDEFEVCFCYKINGQRVVSS
jgi:hypothetical protein